MKEAIEHIEAAIGWLDIDSIDIHTEDSVLNTHDVLEAYSRLTQAIDLLKTQ